MSSHIQKMDNNTVKLQISVDSSEFEQGLRKSYLKNKRKYNIPGFRKGKAPYKIVERYYGEAVFYEDAVNIICPDAYQKAIQEHNIEPVDSPKIDIEQIGSGKDFIFTAEVVVKPDVELGEYKGIEVEKVEYNVKQEDIENRIKQLQENNARLVAVEDRPTENGDIVIMDYKGFIDGEEFEGGKAENQSIEIGKGNFIPGFEEQLVGLKAGQQSTIKVKFPEKYHAKELAGKDAEFEVKIKEIKKKELPQIDDEFAKDVSEFDTLDELKKDIKEKLEKDAQKRARSEMENSLIEKVAKNAKVDIPEVMVNNKIDDMIREFEMNLMYQGMRIDDYLSLMKISLEDLKQKFRDDAYNIVKNTLVLESIAKIEDIQVTDQDLRNEFEKLAKQYNQDVNTLEKNLSDAQKENIRSSLKIRKTVDFLFDNCKIVNTKEESQDKDNQEV